MSQPLPSQAAVFRAPSPASRRGRTAESTRRHLFGSRGSTDSGEVDSDPGSAKKEYHLPDRWFRALISIPALGVPALIAGIIVFLGFRAGPSIVSQGPGFFTGAVWDPVQKEFGVLAFAYGTLVTSLLAVLLATPVAVAAALFTTELASARVAAWATIVMDTLAAIPSVVYGLWGFYILAPALRTGFAAPVSKTLGPYIPFFKGPAYGVGYFTAALVLAIMILPTIASIAREVFKAVPRAQREAALALGATRWEVTRLAVFHPSTSGLAAAILLALGRALGETMAVTMVIGNRGQIAASLFAPGQTMASLIANEYAEAADDIHLAALAEVGLALFLVTFLAQACGRWLLRRYARK